MTHIIQKKEPSPLEAFGEVEEGEVGFISVEKKVSFPLEGW